MLLGASAAYALPPAYAQWEHLRSPDTQTIGFAEGVDFLGKHPGWPEEKLIRLRTEAAALAERPGKAAMANFCTETPPITGRGMIACAEAGIGSGATNAAWIKQGWIQGDFSESEEDRILASHGRTLTTADHDARTDRLLYEGKSAPARRMLTLVSDTTRQRFEVRIAFVSGDKRAPSKLNGLSAPDQRDPGILFERIKWRMKRNDDSYADLFASVPKNAPYPDLWWPMRANAARTLVRERAYAKAYQILGGHGALKPEYLADALWLRGWIALRFRHDAATAYTHFHALYTSVYTPVSKARGAYWAARAANKNGNTDIAREWMEKAARHPTVFYGQLAHGSLRGKAPLQLTTTVPDASDIEKAAFAKNPLVAAARALHADHELKLRDAFLDALGAQARTPGEFALIAALSSELAGPSGGVEAAKQALRNGIVLMPYGWPRIRLPDGLPIEPALTLAITRQESEFNALARSPANARGLMQLLPGTGREVARKLGLAYTVASLDDPDMNMMLGSTYLGQMIAGFDGSYVLGIASYNAGPGSARRWIAQRGMPPRTVDGAIDWIESIPFAETRNYVMRVLENVTVYRTLADPKAPVLLEQDLRR